MMDGWPTEMIVKAARRGRRVVEIPVNYRPRIGEGAPKSGGTLRGTIWATYHILWTILRPRHRIGSTAQTLARAKAMGLRVALLPP